MKETLRKNRKKELGIAKGEYVFLYSGRLSIEKGVRELLEAFGRLQERSAWFLQVEAIPEVWRGAAMKRGCEVCPG